MNVGVRTTVSSHFANAALFVSLLLAAGEGRAGPPRGRPGGHRVGGPAIRLTLPPPPVRVVRPVRPAPALSLSFLLAPPSGHVVLSVAGTTYYRHSHVYYRRAWHGGRWVYMRVAPPVGVIVASLPPTPDRVVINGQVYYRDGATYYVEQRPQAAAANSTLPSSPQYMVTKPPVGAVVEQLPSGAETVTGGGTTYHRVGDVYYLAINAGGVTKYVVVAEPR